MRGQWRWNGAPGVARELLGRRGRRGVPWYGWTRCTLGIRGGRRHRNRGCAGRGTLEECTAVHGWAALVFFAAHREPAALAHMRVSRKNVSIRYRLRNAVELRDHWADVAAPGDGRGRSARVVHADGRANRRP